MRNKFYYLHPSDQHTSLPSTAQRVELAWSLIPHQILFLDNTGDTTPVAVTQGSLTTSGFWILEWSCHQASYVPGRHTELWKAVRTFAPAGRIFTRKSSRGTFEYNPASLSTGEHLERTRSSRIYQDYSGYTPAAIMVCGSRDLARRQPGPLKSIRYAVRDCRYGRYEYATLVLAEIQRMLSSTGHEPYPLCGRGLWTVVRGHPP